MATRTSPATTPESRARAERQRLAAEEGARAMADVEREAIAVRRNMERLRALREARDANADAAAQIETPTAAKPTPTRRVKRIVR